LIASIPSNHTDGVGYFHSFAVTKNYIVFLEQPLRLSPLRLSFKHAFLALLRNKAVSSALIMNDSLPTRIHVIEKKTGRVLPQKFITDPQFTFHHVNAFERNNESENNLQLVVDISSYDAKHFDMKNFSYDKMESGK